MFLMLRHLRSRRLAALEAEWDAYKSFSRRILSAKKPDSKLGAEASCQVNQLTQTINALKAQPKFPLDGSNPKHLLVNGASLEQYSTFKLMTNTAKLSRAVDA